MIRRFPLIDQDETSETPDEFEFAIVKFFNDGIPEASVIKPLPLNVRVPVLLKEVPSKEIVIPLPGVKRRIPVLVTVPLFVNVL